MLNLSIVILTCNQKAYTVRVLSSLRDLMREESGTEVIIIDNGSTDGTDEAVAAMCLGWGKRLTYRCLDRNIGVAAGRNAGLSIASRDAILILDNDTIVSADAIRYLYHRLMNDSTIGLIAPALHSPEGTLQESAKPYPGLGIKLRHLISQHWRRHDEAAPPRECEPDYVMGACQMFRRETQQLVGPFDEHIFYGPEDADFCLRVRAQGLRVIYAPAVCIIHDWQRATSRHRFSRLSMLHIRALLYFYRKHSRIF